MMVPRQQRGVTLVELLVAMGMSATVLGGAVAAIGLSGRTFQSAANGIQSSGALDGLGQISADIHLSLGFTERAPTATTFWVPDRTGDGAPERIRYAWSGTPGDPVTYAINDSTPVEVLPSVNAISFAYIVATVAGQATFADPVGGGSGIVDQVVFERAYSGSPAAIHTVNSPGSVAAIVQPVLPNGSSTFRVTRVVIPMQNPNPGQDITIALHAVNRTTAVPETTVLASTQLRYQSLPATYAAVEIVIENDAIFDAGNHIAVVVSSSSASASALIPLEASPQYFTDGWIATRNPSGVWGVNATRDMPIVIYAEINPEND